MDENKLTTGLLRRPILYSGHAASGQHLFTFSWPVATDADGDAIKDYHFQL